MRADPVGDAVETAASPPAGHGPIPRVLTALGSGGDSALVRDKLRAFRLGLVICVTAETIYRWPTDRIVWPGFGFYALTVALALFLCFRPHSRPALLGLALASLANTWHLFPNAANHQYLAVLGLLLMATVSDESRQDGVQALGAIRLIAAAVLFHAGLQKLLYGHYFQGQALAVLISDDQRFQGLWRLIAPGEVERLRAVRAAAEVAGGDYVLRSIPGLLLSNLIPIGELAVGALMCVRRYRDRAVAAGLVLLLLIEVFAREVNFGLIYGNYLLAAQSRSWGWLAPALTMAAYLIVFLVRAFVPDFRMN